VRSGELRCVAYDWNRKDPEGSLMDHGLVVVFRSTVRVCLADEGISYGRMSTWRLRNFFLLSARG
jgi:hypothetical protein